MGRRLFIPSVCPTSASGSRLHSLAAEVSLSHSMALYRRWACFHVATAAPRETHTPHVARPTLPQQSLPFVTGCPSFLRRESSAFYLIHLTRLEGKAMDTCSPPMPLYLAGGLLGTHSTAAALSKKYPYQSSPSWSFLISFLWLRGASIMGPVYRCCLGNPLWVISYLIRIACTLEPSQNFHFNMHWRLMSDFNYVLV